MEMARKVDQELIPLLIKDEDEVRLFKPTNARDLSEVVGREGVVPSSASLTYDHASELASRWSGQLAELRTGVDRIFGRKKTIASQLWAQQLQRQEQLVWLAESITNHDADRAQSCMEQLYGRLDENYFWESVDQLHRLSQEALEYQHPEIDRAVADLIKLVPARLDFEPTPLPTTETVVAFRQWFLTDMGPWLERLATVESTTGQCEVAKIVEAFTAVLAGTDTKVEVTDEVLSIGYDPMKDRVAIPFERSTTQLRRIVVHEMAHRQRHDNGIHQGPLLLASYGLPGYLPFEEGVTTACEAVLEEPVVESYARLDAYFFTGLAAGFTGRPFTANELYQILRLHHLVRELVGRVKRGEAVDMTVSLKRAHKSAMGRLVRVMRGVPDDFFDNVSGHHCPRDLAYRNGSMALWKWVADHLDQLWLLLAAKADLADPLHAQYMSRYGTRR